MTQRVLAVGGPPSFRATVGSMLSTSEDDVLWVSNAGDVDGLLADAEAPYAVIVAPEIEEQDAIALGRRLSSIAPTTAVVVLRKGLNNGFVPSAMKAGIRDVIDLTGEEDPSLGMTRALAWAESLRQSQPSTRPTSRGHVITVFSSKGGSGKSFLSSNLAVTIAEYWKVDTALVDVDLAMGDAMAYFGHQSTQHLQDILALSHKSDADALRLTAAKLHEHLSGFAAPPDPAAESVSGDAIRALLESVASTFPYVIVDAPGNYQDQVLGALDASDLVVLIASLDVVGVRHLARAVETLRSIGVPAERMRVVLNRADSKVGISPADVERVLNLKITHMIPSSRLVPEALNSGVPVAISQPKSDVAKSIKELAEKLIGKPELEHHKRGRRLFAGN